MTTIMLDSALKSFAILAATGLVCLCWRRGSAAARHLVLFLGMGGLLVLPLCSWLPPLWQKPLWSLSAGSADGNQVALSLQIAPSAGASGPIATASSAPFVVISPGGHTVLHTQINTNWLEVGFFAWAAGALLVFGSMFVAQWRVRQLQRRCQALDDPDWRELLREMDIRRPVALLQYPDGLVPATWGLWHPAVLLPAEAAAWPRERRRMVLRHELAHVRRWDCWTQAVADAACALYWFNPLAWLAARQMRFERERACDDAVLDIGCKASDYAGHLVDIAREFRRLPPAAAVAMARSCQLEGRVAAIVDGTRARGLRPLAGVAVAVLVGGMIVAAAGSEQSSAADSALHRQQIDRLVAFSKAKEAQAEKLAKAAGETISPVFQKFFDAAVKGDGAKVIDMDYNYFQKHHPQYDNKEPEVNLRTSYWQTVLEISIAYDFIVKCEPHYAQMAIDGLVQPVPEGSIYFGGTDPGRGLPTAFCKSHPDADPFFLITQNALADETYLDYVRAMYRLKIYTPTAEDVQNCFKQYLDDVSARFKEHKLKPDENVKMENGRVEVSGVGAVMNINSMLTKIIFDKNPDRPFYVEASWAMDWMYPHLEPDGLIMKLDRQPMATMPKEVVERDRAFWNKTVSGMIGDWVTPETFSAGHDVIR